jgi:hypothetical protein
MQMLTDNPIVTKNKDRFGFAPYAKILSDTIRDTDELPFCIGIFAEWGSGKSSLMNMIQDDLRNNGQIKSIWFNPWKYDKKEDLWNALIQTILYSIIENSKDTETIDKAKDLAKSAVWLLLKKGLSVATSGIVSEANIETITKSIVKNDELHYRHINHFENDFSNVVKKYTDNGKLVIFVDDLDRCLPENAITVLESLKLFIGDARCVFVLGMDHLVVEQGLEIRFSEKIKLSGRDYLDKIIQVPFYLPPVPFNKLKEALAVTKTANFDDRIWKIIELGLGGNPRKTKRFVNSSYLANQILHNRDFVDINFQTDHDLRYISEEIQRFYISKLLIFQMAFLNFYLFLKNHLDAWEIYSTKLLKANTLEIREKEIEKFPAIREFWNDDRLRHFMEKTETDMFPEAPSSPELEPIIQAINLVSNSRGEKSL